MKTLANPQDRAEILRRIGALRTDSPRQWGKMTVGQMICHLCDSCRHVLGELHASPNTSLFQQTILKWAALWVPLRWPRGFPTRPEMEQGRGGTPPAAFENDRAELTRLIERFSVPGVGRAEHPIFGKLTETEWLRWGYLHTDHHLRQFSV